MSLCPPPPPSPPPHHPKSPHLDPPPHRPSLNPPPSNAPPPPPPPPWGPSAHFYWGGGGGVAYRSEETSPRGHQQEHQPQRPTESSDPTQHAKGRTGDQDIQGPVKEQQPDGMSHMGGGGGGDEGVGGCGLVGESGVPPTARDCRLFPSASCFEVPKRGWLAGQGTFWRPKWTSNREPLVRLRGGKLP